MRWNSLSSWRMVDREACLLYGKKVCLIVVLVLLEKVSLASKCGGKGMFYF